MQISQDFLNTVYFQKKKTDQKLLIHYLQNLRQYRDWIREGLSVLTNISTDEDRLREEIALQGYQYATPKVDCSPPIDRKFFLFMETFEEESHQLTQQKNRLQHFLKEEIGLLSGIKTAVLSLPEPQRSIFLYRYFEKKTWKVISKKISKSESFLFQQHTDGIEKVLESIGGDNLRSLRRRHEKLCW